ncbi:MAG: hypothetical protein NTZ26_06490, partial [Candidatus Aminicenantes bacterium]|nr:hypothetical protein [Candidatus Aminicenantes bacterium]
MKARLTGTGMLVAGALILPMVLAVCCVMGPSRPGPVVSQATNIEFISGSIGWEYDENGRVANKSICTLRIRNVGNDPIRSVRFRLTLRYQHSNEP